MSDVALDEWDYRCSFCGKGMEDVRLVSGPDGVFICNECVEMAREVLSADPPEEPRA